MLVPLTPTRGYCKVFVCQLSAHRMGTVTRIQGSMCVQCRDILVRRANVFDAVQTCGTVAFDKTGTLTTGVMAATSMQGLQHQAQHLRQSSSAPQSNSGTALPPRPGSPMCSWMPVEPAQCMYSPMLRHAAGGTPLKSWSASVREDLGAIGLPYKW